MPPERNSLQPLPQKTDFSFEILIHDDASSDRTQNIIKRYQLQYPGVIKTVLQKENQFKKGRTHPDEFLFPLIKGITLGQTFLFFIVGEYF